MHLLWFYAKVRNVTNFHEISRNFVVVRKILQDLRHAILYSGKPNVRKFFREKNGLDNIFAKTKQIFTTIFVSIFAFLNTMSNDTFFSTVEARNTI